MPINMISYFSLCPETKANFCEIRLHVDFDNRLLQPLGILGISLEEASCFKVLLYSRQLCQPSCQQMNCRDCQLKMLYHDNAIKPTGSGLAYSPHNEYLYCLKRQKQPATALLSLIPHEENVEVKELNLLASWFATWFQRSKALLPSASEDASRGPELNTEENKKQELVQYQQSGEQDRFEPEYNNSLIKWTKSVVPNKGAGYDVSTKDVHGQDKSTQYANIVSKYLPNMRIIYQVRKELMLVTLPEPSQLTRSIEVQLVCRKAHSELPLQTVILNPGDEQADCELVVVRDTPYSLMAKIPGQGRPLELLELVTENKVLRVQESRLAPKYMNFLMERRVDQRATFVLHVTFDEKIIDIGSQWLGDFFLDIDAQLWTLSIGTVRAHEHKIYRIEKLIGEPNRVTEGSDQRIQIFEGSVSSETLFTPNVIQLEPESDYLINVIDPVTWYVLPASVLSLRRTSLYVKELRSSDVRLHVTVQCEATPMVPQASNKNNLDGVTNDCHSYSKNNVQTFQRYADGKFFCPLGDGIDHTHYRILHMSNRRSLPQQSARRRFRSNSRCSSASTSATAITTAALDANDASTYSCGGCNNSRSEPDSGLGRNQSSLLYNTDASTVATMHQSRICLHLDVDLTTLKARLVPPPPQSGKNGSSGLRPDSNSCYLIVEEPKMGGKIRSTPCQLGQNFCVNRWCRYMVKTIEECSINPLFKFQLTDREVTDVKLCGVQPVQLTHSVSRLD